MKEPVKTAVILVLGWSCIILGIIGLLLPILQGIPFILLGLYLLAKRSKWAKKLVEKLYHRFPGLASKLREAQHKGEDLVKRGKDFIKRR